MQLKSKFGLIFLFLLAPGFVFAGEPRTLEPSWLSLLPPLIAIFLALLTKRVIFSLFLGVFSGALIVFDFNPLAAFLNLIGRYILPALTDPDHASIIIFSMLLGGMIGVISKNGGTLGIVKLVTRFAKNARWGQFSTWLLGIIIFFDEYANCLVVGNTMRPITDKFKISREKLAYIVDSTGSPIACLTLSVWIGFELGLISDAIKGTGFTGDPFSIFIESIPYRFYPILALILTLMVSVMGRDFGSMLKAERRARTTGKLIRDGATPASDLTDLGTVTAGKDIPRRWINGVFPIVTLIAITLIGLYVTGKDAIIAAGGSDFSLRIVLANASSFTALFWASLSACVLAIAMTLVQRILPLADIMDAWLHGAKSMVLALVILVLAWSIGYVTKELKTAEYIVQILQHSLSPHWLPVLTFIVAAAISFAIGTSWATMAILMPITVPLAWALVQSYGLDAASSQLLLYGSVSSVLAGSVWGDHCSPISDTTVMSSMASACDHIDHVKTQMPYAIFVAIVGMLVGDIPTAYGFSPYLSIIIAIGIFYLFLRFVGKKVDI